MKKISLLCLALCIGLSTTAAFARGGGVGGGMGHHSSSIGTPISGGLPVTGGASGTSAAAPGTNSAGTALSAGRPGGTPQSGPLLGTDPGVDREEAKVNKMIGSICRGC